MDSEDIFKMKEKQYQELKAFDLKSWAAGSFDNVYESFVYHYKKHGKEVGAKNFTQYDRKAVDFAKKKKRSKKFLSKERNPWSNTL